MGVFQEKFLNLLTTIIMEEFTLILAIVFGFLSLILFFKVWGMCNNVRDIKEHLEAASKPKSYHYLLNASYGALKEEVLTIKELAFCGRKEEAQIGLKRLQYQLNEERKHYEERGCDINYHMKDKKALIAELEEHLNK